MKIKSISDIRTEQASKAVKHLSDKDLYKLRKKTHKFLKKEITAGWLNYAAEASELIDVIDAEISLRQLAEIAIEAK